MDPFPHKTHKFNYEKWRKDLKKLERQAAELKAKIQTPGSSRLLYYDLYEVKAKINWMLEIRAWVGGKQKAKPGTNAWVFLSAGSYIFRGLRNLRDKRVKYYLSCLQETIIQHSSVEPYMYQVVPDALG